MGGKAREVGEPITRVFDDADGDAGLNDSGYCLKISTSAEVTKSASGSAVYAVAYTDTRDPLYDGVNFTTTYWKDPEIACIREGTVPVRVDPPGGRSTAIHVGDILALGAVDGAVCHWEDNAAQDTANSGFTLANWMAARSEIVGIAEEALAADSNPSDGSRKILCRLTLFGDES